MGDGVTVAQQILVLLVLVRIQIPQFWPKAKTEQEKLEQVNSRANSAGNIRVALAGGLKLPLRSTALLSTAQGGFG